MRKQIFCLLSALVVLVGCGTQPVEQVADSGNQVITGDGEQLVTLNLPGMT